AVSGPGQEDHLSVVSDIFSQAGFPTTVAAEVEPLIWSKLIVNVGINPLTAITRLKNGQLLEYPGTRRLMEQAVNEAAAVTRAMNIEPIYPDPIEHVLAM
ncbi:MAG: 2-dehydropantoate 2-reductase, partial [Deltaproteobacteria bacterium]|nr:2-dehydropantoate 2-reductase [Deltaproteobacteria bacterium]